jgi:hypothetical protein
VGRTRSRTRDRHSRQDLLENAAGLIEISTCAGRLGTVHIDELGKENMTPYPEFVFAKPVKE